MAAPTPPALDTVQRVETPEGIEIGLRPAGLQARAGAWLIDLLLRLAVLYVLVIALALLGRAGTGVFLVAAFLMEWLYPVAFELLPGAATPGKRVLGLRVVRADGLPVTFGASLARNLLRAADFLPSMYALGAVCVLLRRDFRRLGDLLAGTLVVHVPKVRRPALPQGLAPVAPAVPLTPGQSAALQHLVVRAARINAERLDELAAFAAPGLHVEGPEATRRVLGTGYWLLGARP